MKISSITVYPLKISKAPIYLGNTAQETNEQNYYFRNEYRSVYSRNLETLLVKITADDGTSGWGEALAPVVPEVTGTIIEKLFTPFLIDQDPRNIDYLWNKLYDSMRERGYFSGFMVDAITAIDIALWDLLGKSVGLPVYQLLGGKYRDKIPCYVSGLPVSELEEKIEKAKNWKEKGFSAIKLHLGYDVQEDVEIVSRLRQSLGSSFRLMVDAHWKYTVPQAIQLGRQLQELNIEFLEAPTVPEDIDGHAEITRALDIPIAIGEAKRTIYQFKERLTKRAANILQPDMGRVGITNMRKIANLAEAFHTPIAPHLSVGLGICVAATLQACAAMNNFYILEYQPTVFPTGNEILTTPILCERGVYTLPEGPGLGVDIDEKKVQELSM